MWRCCVTRDSARSTSSSSGTTSPACWLSSERVNPLHAVFLAIGRFVFRYRDYLALVAVPVTILTMPPTVFGGSEIGDLGLDAVGLAVTLAGQALRAVVIGLAYIKRGGRKKE